jgi:glycosyltransferase involved in cell wall biosynthesis
MGSNEGSLRILHVLRAPVGGLFRHVTDLAREQARRGHDVGIIADSSTGDDTASRQLALLAPSMKLGVRRFFMRREPHVSDLAAIARVHREIWRLKPDVLHGHGSKGGFYTRATGFLPSPKRVLRAYTPHGGSFHPQPHHGLYMTVEKLADARTDLLLFESEFIARQFEAKIGASRALRRIAKNGLRPEEFAPVALVADAAEFVYVGELSSNKGVDTLIEALAAIHAGGERAPRLVIVGSGAEIEKLTAMVEHYDLNRHVAFYGVLAARDAFALGRVVVTPSRAESLPYIVMEAIAAGKPIIATDVGGVGEIFGPFRDRLIPRDDARALAEAMVASLRRDPAAAAAEAEKMARHVAEHFCVRVMVDAVLSAYNEALARGQRAGRPAIEGAP